MDYSDIKIGKIIKIEGLTICVEIVESRIADKVSIKMGVNDFVVSINKLIYSVLPTGKKIVARISKISDRNIFDKETFFSKPSSEKFLLEADLIGIYDDFLMKFDTGINEFPIISSDVYSVDKDICSSVLHVDSEHRIALGKSYIDSTLTVYADPDILFGKHLGVFGNTGTGKTCTIASLLQGLKSRLTDSNGCSVSVAPKIIIFDSNNEYESAFTNEKFKVKVVKKEEIKLPHHFLSYTEYYKLLGASQGVQAPTLKEAIDTLRKDNHSNEFQFKDLPEMIVKILKGKSKDNFSFNQWYGWNSTMINRIQRIIDDERISAILEHSKGQNFMEEILTCSEEIILIQADFDKDELDIVMFLFSKQIYKWAVQNNKGKQLLLLLEEAHRYINEEDQDYKLGNYYIERLAREGRKFGISLIISSQRPSELSKTVMSQCNSFIIHRINNKNDLDFINKTLSANSQGLLKVIPGLAQQHAIIVGEAFGYPEIVKIEIACPTPQSNDPAVIRSWKPRE